MLREASRRLVSAILVEMCSEASTNPLLFNKDSHAPCLFCATWKKVSVEEYRQKRRALCRNCRSFWTMPLSLFRHLLLLRQGWSAVSLKLEQSNG